MKLLKFYKVAALIACAATSVSSLAQSSSDTSNATVNAVSASDSVASSPKAIRAANRALTKQVLKTLSRTRQLDSSRIFVKARNGNVTLSGTVPEADQMPLAMSATQRVAGVSSVSNMLRLQDHNK